MKNRLKTKMLTLALGLFLSGLGISSRADSVVVINEIMYHPLGDEAALEWIELYNQCSVDVDISNWSLQGGIEYDFTNGVVIPTGGYLVIANSPTGLLAQTGFLAAEGPFKGRLSNGGESIRLVNNTDRVMNEVDYRDGGAWPAAPDGSGASLARRNQQDASQTPEGWGWSTAIGGTLGASNDTYATGDLTINETTPAWETDFRMELHNDGIGAINLAGFIIRCMGTVTGEYVFSSQLINSMGHLTVDDTTLGFHPADEDRLFLYDAATNVIDAAVVKNRLRGRYPDGTGPWQYPVAETPNGANDVRVQTGIVINEIMYHYGGSSYQPLVESDEEWIELYNRSGTNMNLGGWALKDGISYTFPVGTMIAPGNYLVVAKDKASLAVKYTSIDIVGDFGGTLGNGGDRILLVDAADNTADEVIYCDGRPWPDYADGLGSSLELRHPDADNSVLGAWAASDESTKSVWTNYSYTVAATNPVYDPNGNNKYPELRIGLLYAGEILLDNISVIEDPNGSPRELMQNGTFSAAMDKWRFMGNHEFSEVIPNPDNPPNDCLRLLSSGPTSYLSNRGESTLKFGANYVPVVAGTEYRISFDAKWIGGCPQLHTELYYNEVARSTPLLMPASLGTPGARNSRYEANIGPTLNNAIHAPAVPPAGQPALVSVTATDPDGIGSMTLWYSVAGGAWSSGPMAAGAEGLYTANIPGQGAGVSVEFYIEGVDMLSATSRWPVQVDARAMLEFEDGRSVGNKHNIRIIMTQSEWNFMFDGFREMGNHRLGCTVIYDEREIFYDCRIRLKGSMWSRPNGGFNLRFPADHLFRGVHDGVRFDHRNSQEVIVKHMICRAGLIGNRYDDVVREMTPGGQGTYQMFMAEYGDVFLNSQFENASEGTLHKFEGIRVVNNTFDGTTEGYKSMAGIGWIGSLDIRDLGNDKEDYRWMMLIRNNRARDDFSKYIAMARTWSLNGAALQAAVEDVMDVDAWMRTFAMASLAGIGDMYTQGNPHNLALFAPSDGKVAPLPWDWDFTFSRSTSSPLWGGKNLSKIIALPVFTRLFHCHLYDIIDTTYNTEYMAPWLVHYRERFGAGFNYDAYINNRRAYVLSQLPPEIPFTITSSTNFSVDADFATVQGDGWFNVHQMRFAGSSDPLALTWLDGDSWSVSFAVEWGVNELVLEAYDYQGNLIATNLLTITSTVQSRPLRDDLRITELMYDPVGGSAYEYIELHNAGTNTLALSNVFFNAGITYSFSNQTLAAGAYAVLVKDLAAFTSRYGSNGIDIAGVYDGSLANGGESIELLGAFNAPILDFEYRDARGWPVAADGPGHSLVPLDRAIQPNEELDYGGNWRASTYRIGSPGIADPAPFTNVVINEIAAHTDNFDTNNFPLYDSDDWVELYNAAGTNINLGDWYLSDDPDELKKWAIPNSNTVNAADWIDFDETTGFHSPITNGFGLDKSGEALYLSYLPGTAQDRVADAIRFKGQENEVSWGRFMDGQPWLFTLARTRGAANALASIQRIVMAEVHYHPEPNELHAEDNDEDEYIVLLNDNPFDVTLESEAGPWRMNGEVGYTFPANTVLPALSETLVVSFDPADTNLLNDFLFTYGLTNGQVDLYGPWSGKLDNHVGRVALERPQLPDLVTESVSWVLVDEMIYFDRNPWPTEADGGGASLHRINNVGSGNAPTNWVAGSPSPGSSLVGFLPVVNNTNGATGVGPFSATVNGALVSTGSAPTLVTLYWGTNDALKTHSAWEVAVDLGSSVPGPLSTPLAGLTQNTIYYYRYYATNAIGGAWSFPSASFKTLGPPGVANTGAIPAVGNVDAQGSLTNGTLADVTVYWGTSDGGAIAGNWDQQADLGNLSEGAFAATLSGLLYGQCYFYRSYASNTAGEAWADRSVAFTTLSPSGAVYSINNSAPSGITPTSVDVGGTLNSAQAVFDVIAYWGTVDGGTDPSAWTKSQFIGSFTNVTGFNFGATLNGLNPNTDYFTTFLMTNCSEGVWAVPSQTFTTEPEPIDTNAFAHSTKFTFCGYRKNETLTNFPVLIQLSTNLTGFAYGQFNPQAADLRFIDEQLTALFYEIELWDPGGISYVWVQIPELVDSNTFIRAYWGNPAETIIPPYTTNGATWSEDYAGVWHMDQTSPPDASGHGNLAVGTSTIVGNGRIGAGIELDGVGAFLDITQNYRLPIYNNGNGNRFTIEGWVKGPDQTGSKRVFSEASTVNNDPVYGFNTKKTQAKTSRFYVRDNVGAVKQDKDTVYQHFDGTWHYVAWVEGSGASVISYADGVRDPRSFGYTRSTLTLDSTTIGALKRSVISHFFDGVIDEFRISYEDRSSNWVWTTWFNVASNEAFICSSGAPDAEVDTDGDGMLDNDEMIANTDPLDPNSFLWLQIDQTGTSATHWLTFPTSTGRIYRVESNPDLYSNDWTIVVSNLPGIGTNRSLMRTGLTDRVYYRIGVESP